MEKQVLNFEEILTECGVFNEPPQSAIQKLSSLDEFYSNSDVCNIYNYILLNTKNVEILIGVIKFCDKYKSSETLEIITNILIQKITFSDSQDMITTLRSLCAKIIAKYKNKDSVGALLYCLNNKDEDYKIRLACADALGRIGDRYAVNSLINIVEDEEEKSVYVKESATFALGLLGDSNAIDPLVKILESKQNFLGKFSFLKEKIVEALGKLNINNKKVLKVLKNSLYDSSPMVRINAIEALMNSEYEEAESLIRNSLKDEDDEVQRNALVALYNLLGRDILDEVISLPSYSKFLKCEAQIMIEEYEEGNDT